MEVQIPFVNFYANGKSSHRHAIREDIASEIVNVSKVSSVPGPSSYFFTYLDIASECIKSVLQVN